MKKILIALLLLVSSLQAAEVMFDVELPQSYSRMALNLNTDYSQLPGPVDAVWLKGTYNDDKSITIEEYVVPVGYTDGNTGSSYVPSTDPNLITTANRPVQGTLIHGSNSPTFDTFEVVELLDVVDGNHEGIIVPMIIGRDITDDIEMSYLYGRTFLPEVVEVPTISTIAFNGGTEDNPKAWMEDDLTFTLENTELIATYFIINGDVVDRNTDPALRVITAERMWSLNYIGKLQLIIETTNLTKPVWIEILPPVIIVPLPPAVVCHTDTATKAQIRGLILQLRNLINNTSIPSAMTSVSDLYSKVDEINAELDVLGCLNDG